MFHASIYAVTLNSSYRIAANEIPLQNSRIHSTCLTSHCSAEWWFRPCRILGMYTGDRPS